MTLGTVFWFVGGVLFVVAAFIATVHVELFWVFLGVACGFFGVALGGVTFPNVATKA